MVTSRTAISRPRAITKVARHLYVKCICFLQISFLRRERDVIEESFLIRFIQTESDLIRSLEGSRECLSPFPGRISDWPGSIPNSRVSVHRPHLSSRIHHA